MYTTLRHARANSRHPASSARAATSPTRPSIRETSSGSAASCASPSFISRAALDRHRRAHHSICARAFCRCSSRCTPPFFRACAPPLDWPDPAALVLAPPPFARACACACAPLTPLRVCCRRASKDCRGLCQRPDRVGAPPAGVVVRWRRRWLRREGWARCCARQLQMPQQPLLDVAAPTRVPTRRGLHRSVQRITVMLAAVCSAVLAAGNANRPGAGARGPVAVPVATHLVPEAGEKGAGVRGARRRLPFVSRRAVFATE